MFETELSSFYAMLLFVFSSLIPVLNPFGGAMFFTTLTNDFDPDIRRQLANRIGIYSTLTLFVCLYAGSIILNFFGISIGILRVAGGIVLFSAGWQALNAPSADETSVPKKPKSKAAISTMAFYPFTLPLTTGPGSISVAVAIGATPTKDAGALAGTVMGVLGSCLLVWVCYRYSDRITRAVGTAGADAIARIFAFILICIGVATFWSGFSELYTALPR
jgi:multiple antibiotic resistance protein